MLHNTSCVYICVFSVLLMFLFILFVFCVPLCVIACVATRSSHFSCGMRHFINVISVNGSYEKKIINRSENGLLLGLFSVSRYRINCSEWNAHDERWTKRWLIASHVFYRKYAKKKQPLLGSWGKALRFDGLSVWCENIVQYSRCHSLCQSLCVFQYFFIFFCFFFRKELISGFAYSFTSVALWITVIIISRTTAADCRPDIAGVGRHTLWRRGRLTYTFCILMEAIFYR